MRTVVSKGQSFINAKFLIRVVNQKLKDVFIQSWTSKINIESESNAYIIFKKRALETII